MSMSTTIFSVAQIVKLLQSPRKRILWEQKCHNKMWGKDLRKRNVLSCWRKIGNEDDDWMSSEWKVTSSRTVNYTYSRTDCCSWSRRRWENSTQTVDDHHDSSLPSASNLPPSPSPPRTIVHHHHHYHCTIIRPMQAVNSTKKTSLRNSEFKNLSKVKNCDIMISFYAAALDWWLVRTNS